MPDGDLEFVRKYHPNATGSVMLFVSRDAGGSGCNFGFRVLGGLTQSDLAKMFGCLLHGVDEEVEHHARTHAKDPAAFVNAVMNERKRLKKIRPIEERRCEIVTPIEPADVKPRSRL